MCNHVNRRQYNLVPNQWGRQYVSVVEILKVESLFTAVMVTENSISFSAEHAGRMHFH